MLFYCEAFRNVRLWNFTWLSISVGDWVLKRWWVYFLFVCELLLTCLNIPPPHLLTPPTSFRWPVSLYPTTWPPPSTRTSLTWRQPPRFAARSCARGRAAALGEATTPVTTCTWTPTTSASCVRTGSTLQSVARPPPTWASGLRTSPVSATLEGSVHPDCSLQPRLKSSGFNLITSD